MGDLPKSGTLYTYTDTFHARGHRLCLTNCQIQLNRSPFGSSAKIMQNPGAARYRSCLLRLLFLQVCPLENTQSHLQAAIQQNESSRQLCRARKLQRDPLGLILRGAECRQVSQLPVDADGAQDPASPVQCCHAGGRR